MIDPMLEAARAHTKEPQEVDWERRFEDALKIIDYWHGRSSDRMHALEDAKKENKRLKDVILRLEQRCASAEGRETEDGPENPHEDFLQIVGNSALPVDGFQGTLIGSVGSQVVTGNGLLTCNDCGKLLYRSTKDLHKCYISPIIKCTKCNATFHNSDGHECEERDAVDDYEDGTSGGFF